MNNLADTLKNIATSRKGFLLFLGPAFVASIAYMDPGNFATNIAAGSDFGYMLIWVILASNLMAQVIQYLSAKLGIATGKTLPQLCRERFSRPVALFLWFVAEIVAIATDLAEFLGAALGFYLLFNIPLLAAAVITGVLVFAILAIERFGFRKLEYTIMAFVGAILAAYVFEVFIAKPDWGKVAFHTFVPLIGSDSIYIAVGMLGATVMPHVIYLHSALVQPRVREGHVKKKHLSATRWDVLIAMNLAFFINAAMVIMAAAVFYANGRKVEGIEEAYQTLTPLLGSAASSVFAFALLCSGLSSSTVGTMAGQVIMEGFLKIRVPVFLRRLVTMLPAFAVIGLGFDPLQILILSQVVLSFGIPFALVPLIMFTSDRKLMGEEVNRKRTTLVAGAIAAVIILLNLLLLYQIFGGKF
ncbi:TPA: divalent metal cation transporter [Candidatus Micrarchaeota archaeon]|nr:divalent metal cation transporter [Candidatus Micrarchaeota archaeon]HIH30325.1 divalent metal cation transporter [Candidatus Micrarchaeota archaeon]